MLPPDSGPLRMATLETPDPVHTEKEAAKSMRSVDDCLVSEVCIDEYLWSLYQRTPKRDTIKVERSKGKQKLLRMVSHGRSFKRLHSWLPKTLHGNT